MKRKDHALDISNHEEANSIELNASLETETSLSAEDDELLYRLRRIVNENIANIDIETLRKRLELSSGALNDFTKRTTGLTPKSLILNIKMEYAARLLHTTERTIEDIAMECGYYDSSYFHRVFTRSYGMSPGAYRKAKSV